MTAPAPRFGVLINPTAGHGRGRKRGREALNEFRRRGLTVVDLSQPTPRAAFDLAEELDGEYDVLVVVGGDGMAHMGINLVAATDKPLGLIPVGSGNDFARHLQLPVHRVSDAIDVILTSLVTGAQAVDAMKLIPMAEGALASIDYPTSHRWAGCVVSAGFDSMVNSRANTYTWPRGRGRYIRGVVRELRTFAPYPYRISIDNEVNAFDGTLVAVANAPSFGGGMKIAPGARVNSGELEVVIATEVTRAQLLRVFPRVFTGSHVNHPAVRVTRGQEVLISPSEGGVIPEIFADGEPVGKAPVAIQACPGVVQMLCPRLDP